MNILDSNDEQSNLNRAVDKLKNRLDNNKRSRLIDLLSKYEHLFDGRLRDLIVHHQCILT